MSEEAPCLKVPRILGEKAIDLAKKLDFLNQDLKVDQLGDYLCIPLLAEVRCSHVKEFGRTLSEFEVTVHSFPRRARRTLTLFGILEDELPARLLARLPHAIDFVGNIAVVDIPAGLEGHRKTIGKAILRTHKHIHTVLGKVGAVEGAYRLREFEILAGLDRTETVHKEYGCRFHVDLAKAYFSPRLSYEHNRVASEVEEGETVIDMFTGVGPFSILIAKKRKRVRVFAIDANPTAIQLLRRNISTNNVVKQVTPVLGDAREVIKRDLYGVADRVIMNLPEKAIEYVDVACEAIKPEGGIMHYYAFTTAPQPLETAKIRLIEAIEETDCDVMEISSARKVRATAPYTWQVAIAAEIH